MDDGVEIPARGSPESAAAFRAALDEIGKTQGSLARPMVRNGDDRKHATIRRTIQRMALGEARVSGEMRVILTMLKRARRKAVAQKAGGLSPPLECSTSAERDGRETLG